MNATHAKLRAAVVSVKQRSIVDLLGQEKSPATTLVRSGSKAVLRGRE
jgi:hypothetical protein